MQIGTIRTSFPGAREWTRHDVLACLSIDAAAFKSLLLGAGCHGRANHQTGSRPAPALFARGTLMRRTLALRARTVVSETSRFGRGCVRLAGESHDSLHSTRVNLPRTAFLSLAGARFESLRAQVRLGCASASRSPTSSAGDWLWKMRARSRSPRSNASAGSSGSSLERRRLSRRRPLFWC